MGGMELGSIWGHGSYVAPDWTADWLHREALFVLEEWARAGTGSAYADLSAEQQAPLLARLKQTMRTNTYDASSAVLRVDPVRGKAFEANAAHYADVFTKGRAEYAIPAGDAHRSGQAAAARGVLLLVGLGGVDQPTGRDHHLHQQLAARAAGRQHADRGRGRLDRRQHHRAAGRHRRDGVVARLAAAGRAAWRRARRTTRCSGPRRRRRSGRPSSTSGPSRPCSSLQIAARRHHRALRRRGRRLLRHSAGSRSCPTPSRAPGTCSSGSSGLPPRGWRPGCTSGPRSAARSRRFQRLGVNVLFGALLVVVLGSMAGEWLSVKQCCSSGTMWFYFGHSGYEYIDLGRAFQIGSAGRAVPVAVPRRAGDPAGAADATTSSAASSRCSSCRRSPSPASTAPRSATGATRTSPWPSTGGGGWCTCGSKASSRCSRPW